MVILSWVFPGLYACCALMFLLGHIYTRFHAMVCRICAILPVLSYNLFWAGRCSTTCLAGNLLHCGRFRKTHRRSHVAIASSIPAAPAVPSNIAVSNASVVFLAIARTFLCNDSAKHLPGDPASYMLRVRIRDVKRPHAIYQN